MSMSIAVVEARETRINVLNPAEWRLLDRSQPIIAESTTETTILKNTDAVPSPVDHSPSRVAIGSVIAGFIIKISSGFSVFFVYFPKLRIAPPPLRQTPPLRGTARRRAEFLLLSC